MRTFSNHMLTYTLTVFHGCSPSKAIRYILQHEFTYLKLVTEAQVVLTFEFGLFVLKEDH